MIKYSNFFDYLREDIIHHNTLTVKSISKLYPKLKAFLIEFIEIYNNKYPSSDYTERLVIKCENSHSFLISTYNSKLHVYYINIRNDEFKLKFNNDYYTIKTANELLKFIEDNLLNILNTNHNR